MIVASNVDLAESDLTPMDPQEVVAAAMGRAGGAAAPRDATSLTTDQDHERTQRVWWYLLFAGIVLLALETLLGNRLSRSGTQYGVRLAGSKTRL